MPVLTLAGTNSNSFLPQLPSLCGPVSIFHIQPTTSLGAHTTKLDYPPIMDPSNRPPVTPNCDTSEDCIAPDRDIGSPGWPLCRPTREALNYLEQALTTGIPNPTYDGPIRYLVKHDGRYAVDLAFTLPLETPLHTAQSTSAQVRLLVPIFSQQH